MSETGKGFAGFRSGEVGDVAFVVDESTGAAVIAVDIKNKKGYRRHSVKMTIEGEPLKAFAVFVKGFKQGG